ncbi:DEAD/DEAH box helicase [Neobacillus sp. PS3-12]|uniref:DEAD/DEAH box helicase n=1 Tax=Neobacillus sp. PS3-12 TaxID=3070677 RepID=UPI0027E194B1|nr:DEAD/DEAH box helicase [Neobacillus sp. PS3-12]WML53024.1 DEAD/DEAH box helicase [Neobacillus sp. PS3-12]
MSKLAVIYPQAVEHTKRKVFEDIYSYLEMKENMPSFDQYLQERMNYLEQIWLNVWLNKVTNDIPRNEKKQILSEKGFEVAGVDRKLINRLFRNEMRTYQPFKVLEWLTETIGENKQDWENRYYHARADFLKREKQARLQEKKDKFKFLIKDEAESIFMENSDQIFLSVRYAVAKQLSNDFKTKRKYKTVDKFALEEKLVEEGSFQNSEYTTIPTFFEELTGEINKTLEWGRSYYTYETYDYVYGRLISDSLADILIEIVNDQLSPKLKNQYSEIFSEEISDTFIWGSISDLAEEFEEEIISEIEEEYVSDLLTLAETPFNLVKHQEQYEKDLIRREKRKAEELAEIQRRREEEERMMEDIFGQEYNPSPDRQIHYTLHIGETNTGKTHHALERMKEAISGIYLAPLRLLALEVYDKLNSEGTPCSLKTGEEEKMTAGAAHTSCTVEMFQEKDFYEVVVIDEAQMITDKDRGFSWYKAITKAKANEVHIIGSRNSKSMLLQLLGEAEITITEYTRDTPLEVETKEFKITHVKKGDALICFSRRRVLETASKLQHDGHSVSMIYGSMPPETRKKQIQHFNNGDTKVIVSTDAIGMGLNLPIHRIVFLENEKFDGTRRRRLSSQEVKQIAGRAGRKGIYNVGKVAFTKEIKLMERLLLQEDEPVHTFAIAPTNSVFERFQKYYHDLDTFFELWERFNSPNGTKKASLSEERLLYERISGTEIEARLSMMDLYGFLHLPFSTKEQELISQWEETMYAIVNGEKLPDPHIKNRNLEELELSYKSIGLHLLFLYRLGQRTEAFYWERVREEISEQVHERLKSDIKKFTKKCRNCGKNLPWESEFQICDTCHSARYRNRYYS